MLTPAVFKAGKQGRKLHMTLIGAFPGLLQEINKLHTKKGRGNSPDLMAYDDRYRTRIGIYAKLNGEGLTGRPLSFSYCLNKTSPGLFIRQPNVV